VYQFTTAADSPWSMWHLGALQTSIWMP